MNDVVKIFMKDGCTHYYNPDEYTDYDWNKSAFIVKDGLQWIGIFNWDEVSKVMVYPKEEK